MELLRFFNIKELLVLVLFLFLNVMLIKVYIKWRKFANVVDKIPGPIALPYIGNGLEFLFSSSMNLLGVFSYLFHEYGPVFRIWAGSTPLIAIKDPEVVEAVLNSPVNIEKAYGYLFLYPWLGDGLLTTSGNKWHLHRKLITPTFHFKVLEEFMTIFQEKANVLVNKLEKNCDTGPFNIHLDITLVTLYGLCESAMGIDFDVKSGAPVKFIESLLDVSTMASERMKCFVLHPDFIFYKTQRGKRFKEKIKSLHEFTINIIQERKKNRNKILYRQLSAEELGIKRKHTFLDLLLDYTDNLSEDMIRDEVATFAFAGHDTVASTVYFCLFALANNLECQDKVYKELCDIFFGEERNTTMEDAGNMKYLERAIKETMRKYTPVPFIGRKIVQDIKVGKYHIPVGAHVMLQIYHMHNDPKLFPNPKVFDPDRFLPDAILDRHKYAFIPFSAGSRNCIGQKYGMLLAKVLLATILRRYKITTLESEKDMRLSMDLVMRPVKEYNIILERRKKNT